MAHVAPRRLEKTRIGCHGCALPTLLCKLLRYDPISSLSLYFRVEHNGANAHFIECCERQVWRDGSVAEWVQYLKCFETFHMGCFGYAHAVEVGDPG